MRNTAVRTFLFAFVTLTVGAGAEAAPIINNFGLLSPDATVTFSEHALADNTLVTNQFADVGVTLSPGAYVNPQAGFLSPDYLGNFTFNNDPTYDPFSILFTNDVTGAAVEVVTNPGTTTFTALLNGSVVESFAAATSSTAGAYYGFTGVVFDELRIDPNNTFALIDNVEFDTTATPVPEPASLLLLGSGIAGIAAKVRKRRKQQSIA